MWRYAFDAIGTRFELLFWDDLPHSTLHELAAACEQTAHAFDAVYSRFRADSLVTELQHEVGRHEVPPDFVPMLRLYQQLSAATLGKITPTIGVALEDYGYDAAYSFAERPTKRTVYTLEESVTVVSDTTIELHKNTLFDFGALGKGYLIDKLYEQLAAAGCQRFLVDGSGDVRYQGDVPIVAALENPHNHTQAIGTKSLQTGSLCASATNRRSWGEGRHHYIDPTTGQSPEHIVATWVAAASAALADGLSSALFFVSPEALHEFSFEYLLVNQEGNYKTSPQFGAEMFL